MKPDKLTKTLITTIAMVGLVMLLMRFAQPVSAQVQGPHNIVHYKVVATELRPMTSSEASQKQLQGVLDREGFDGWELVINMSAGGNDVLIFKR